MPFVSLWQFVAALLLNLIYVGLYYQMDDEASMLHGVSRILAGELPYRDFTSDITPGSYFLSVAYFGLAGFSPLAVRGLLAVLAALTGLVVQALANRVLSGPWRYLPWLLWSTSGVYTHFILNYHWVGVVAVLSGLYWATRWVESPSRGHALRLGFCGGLSFWILQSDGLALALIAGIAWLRFRPAGVGWVGLGAVLTSLVLWLPLLPWWSTVWQENFLALRRHVGTRSTPFDPWLGWKSLQGLAHTSGDPLGSLAALCRSWLVWERYSLFYPVLLLELWLAERRKQKLPALLAWALVGWCLTFLSRQTLPYLGYSGPLYYLVLASLLSRTRRPSLCLALAAVAAMSYAVRAMDLKERYRYPVPTRSGLYWSQDPREAASMMVVHQWVSERMPPQSQVLAYPYFTSLYITENLRNGCREALFIEGVFAPQRLQACVESLRRQSVPYLVVMPLVSQAVSEVCAISPQEYEQAREQWLEWVTRDYERVETRGIVSLYRRRP
jgi:hypothetical protein